MSLQISSSRGMLRRARKIPETLRVSPMLVSTPYFLGTSISCLQMSMPPLNTVQSTPSAPLRASARSVVVVILQSGHSMASLIRWHTLRTFSRLLGLRSIRAISQSLNAGKVSRSRIQLVVNCKLPAPINANFFIGALPFFSKSTFIIPS